VLSRPQEGNLDYIYHPKALAKDVLLLGKRAYADVVDSVKFAIARHGISAKRWREQIEGFKEIADVAKLRRGGLRLKGHWTRPRRRSGNLEGFSIRSTRSGRKRTTVSLATSSAPHIGQ
jgi:hypothetical protein